jgi:tetratricopeptide (TPR) repeat protein
VASTGDGSGTAGEPAASCQYAAALNEAGDREGAHTAYLKVLGANPSSECALAGAQQTAASTSVWAWLGDAAENAGKALAALLLAALLVAVLVLLWLQVQTRTPLLRDRAPAKGIRRPTLQIGSIDDAALGEHLGSATAGLIRGRISWRKDRFGVNLVSGQAGVATALSGLGDISGEAKAAVAVINFLTATLPRRRFILTGELQPPGAEGAGVSLELNQEEDYEALITFWATPLDLGKEASADVYQHLAIAAAAWVDHRMASAVGGDDLLTGDPQSWALFRCGLDAQRQGDDDRALLLYEQARVKDGANVGALANLGILCRRRNEYEDAERYLNQALRATEESAVLPKLQKDLNPDWYRIKYQLAALYTNWASDMDPGAERDELSKEAAGRARDGAIEVLKATVKPPSDGIGAKAPAGYVEKTLTPFLKGTVEPSALVLVACTAADSAKTSFKRRPTRAEVLTSLESDSVDPWQLIAYVERGPDHPPNAFFDLACFYTRTGEFADAADRLITAVRDTPISERKALIEVAKNDPTLKSMRDRRPGLIPRLRELFDPGSGLKEEEKALANEFVLEGHLHDRLEREGWAVSWTKPDSHFTMIAKRDSESLLVEIASANDAYDDERAMVTLGRLTRHRAGSDGSGARVLVVVPQNTKIVGSEHQRVEVDEVEVVRVSRRGASIVFEPI